MTVPQERLALVFLYSLALGAVFGLAYDFFRVRRIAFEFCDLSVFGKKIAEKLDVAYVFAEDVVYSVFCSASVCVFIYYMNSGRFRALALVGIVVGFFCYYNTVGRLVIRCSGVIIGFIKAVLKAFYRYAVYPVFKIVKRIFAVTVGRVRDRAFTVIYKAYALKRAEAGFGIIRNKGKIKDEEPFKYIRKSRRGGVHSVLHGNHNPDAV